ncbi:HigA family addiction module antitoxin [Paraburkholderia strydomiana]|uniref:HigA family addiction module antitoxin n=1 Tax=Paraburkholderia strydomiana TaxID=1245417 RepID=UPI0038BB74E3
MGNADIVHPGTTVRQICLDRFNLTVTEGARLLGVSRQALSNLLTGKAGISPEMAIRLDQVFGGGAETWLQRQVLYDLADARVRLASVKLLSLTPETQPALF